MTEEEETLSFEQTTLKKAVIDRNTWKQVRDSSEFRNLVVARLATPGGPTDMATKLAWLGAGTLSFFQDCLERAGVSAKQAAKDFCPDGDVSPAITSLHAGSEVWLKWMVKHGADLSWKNHTGSNISAFVFEPTYLATLKGYSGAYEFIQPSIIKNWAKGQVRCVNYLRKLNKGKTWKEISQHKDWGGRAMKENLNKNLEQLQKKEWLIHSDPDTRAFVRTQMLAVFTDPVANVKKSSPKM